MLRVAFFGWIMLLVTGCSQTIVPNTSNSIMTATPTRVFTASTAVNPIATTYPKNEQETPVMNEAPIPTPLDSSLDKIVTQVKDDLANRLAIDPGQIELVEAVSVTWPDKSLGCPQPGLEYPQVQVEGILIRLRVGDNIYEYHGGGGRVPFLCE